MFLFHLKLNNFCCFVIRRSGESCFYSLEKTTCVALYQPPKALPGHGTATNWSSEVYTLKHPNNKSVKYLFFQRMHLTMLRSNNTWLSTEGKKLFFSEWVTSSHSCRASFAGICSYLLSFEQRQVWVVFCGILSSSCSPRFPSPLVPCSSVTVHLVSLSQSHSVRSFVVPCMLCASTSYDCVRGPCVSPWGRRLKTLLSLPPANVHSEWTFYIVLTLTETAIPIIDQQDRAEGKQIYRRDHKRFSTKDHKQRIITRCGHEPSFSSEWQTSTLQTMG